MITPFTLYYKVDLVKAYYRAPIFNGMATFVAFKLPGTP
jgi:hypothetical protein